MSMASFPPPPVDTIDWDDIGFRVREVNGHIESRLSLAPSLTPPTWSPPTFHPSPHLSIHGLAPALNYGQQAYEGIKAFRTPTNRIAIFRPTLNAARLAHSATYLSLPPPPPPHFLTCVRAAVALNAAFVPPHHTGAALYIRPLLLGTSAQLGLNPPEEYTLCVFVVPVGVYHGVGAADALVLEEFDRAAPRGTGGGKVGGNYAPVWRWSEGARGQGFGITLHLDAGTRSEIEEFSTSAFIGIRKEGERITMVVPDSVNAIASVTADSACALGVAWGWGLERRRVAVEELGRFQEVIAAGTAASLVPVKSITMRSRGERWAFEGGEGEGGGMGGECCRRLLKALKEVQMGIGEDRWGWLDFVEGEMGGVVVDGVETVGDEGKRGEGEKGEKRGA